MSRAYSLIRSTKRGLMGNLAAASASASLATWMVTPSISNMMRPGLTRATHNSGVPLPEPMRTSSGFFDTGTSGNTRIQTRPERFMCRVSARRAASIWRAVTRSGSIALSPNWPNARSIALEATPWMRPLWALRNLVRIGCSIIYAFIDPVRSGCIPARPAGLALGHFLVLRHRVVLHDLALEDPDFHAAGAVGGERRRHAVIDVGAQGVQRHAAFAIPLHPCDFGTAEPAGAVDADAASAKPHRRLHGALHRAAKGDAALELLRDRFGDQLRVELRFTYFHDVDHNITISQRRDPAAQLLDVGALLADDDARAGRMDGDAAFLVRALDDDLRHRGLLELFHQRLADFHVLVQQRAVARLAGIPPRVPGAVDAEPKPDRIDFLTHGLLLTASRYCAAASTSRTTMVR